MKKTSEDSSKKSKKKTTIITTHSFDTMVWTAKELLCCDCNEDNEVYLSIKMYTELDSDDDCSVKEKYGKKPKGLTKNQILSEDFQYILPKKINGFAVWYDGFILWSEELRRTYLTEILPLKITTETTIEDIKEWLKGDEKRISYWKDYDLTVGEFECIKMHLK